MAATRYIAAGSTTLGTVGAGDDIYILGGSAEMVTNMDQKALLDIASVDIGKEFNGSYGTSAAPFKALLTGTFWYNPSGGQAHWHSIGSFADPLGAASLKLIMPSGSSGAMYFGGVASGAITSAEIAGGSLIVDTLGVITSLYIGQSGSVRLYDSASTFPTLIQQTGGELYLDRGATTINHSGGSCWVQGVAANAITTLTINGGGMVHLVESGTITTLNAWGHIPNCRKLIRPLTITNTNINLSLPGAEDFLNNPLITHSSVTKYMGR